MHSDAEEKYLQFGLNYIFEDSPFSYAIASKDLEIQYDKPLREQMDGTLNAAMDADPSPKSKFTRRKFIGKSCALLAAVLGYKPTHRVLGDLSIGAIGGAGGNLITDYIKEIDKNEDYSVSPDFITRIISVPYNSSLLKSIHGSTAGERALLGSMLNHSMGDGADEYLALNLKNLQSVIDQNESHDVKSFASCRLAVDNFRLGDAQEAVAALDNIDFRNLTDPRSRIAMIEHRSAIVLASLREDNFREFGGNAAKKLIEDSEGFFASASDALDCGDSGILGMSISTVNQAKHMALFQGANLSFAAADQIHRDWAESYRRGAECGKSNDPNEAQSIAASYCLDYIHSLTRVAYHAAAWGNFELAYDLTERALGRARSDDSVGIIEARKRALSSPNLNTRWMLLLRSVLGKRMGIETEGSSLRDIGEGSGSGGKGAHPLLFAINHLEPSQRQTRPACRYLFMPDTKMYRSYITTLSNIPDRI